jgi:hypothetical protein
VSYLFVLPIFGLDLSVPKLDEDILKISAKYGYAYNSEMSTLNISVLSTGIILLLCSIILMFFRIKYSNYAFVTSIFVFYFSYFTEDKSLIFFTNVEDVFEYTLAFMEGMIVTLILFNDDIGFPKIGRQT